ncbi:hypothetical protein [Aquiluna sp. KACHI24]|uniref:hypothetical protein n=1 Tax=Aquiluna sp. KACHI24 TaxID=2968831 RepID=UPI00220ECD61|nr:hypothetical protein [Aquiluna sp. KACHI24]BDQ00950.1 hypothetical protein AKACHI_12860 [Aquiluna sp. KACHI24]
MSFEIEISESELNRVLLIQALGVDFFLHRFLAGESIPLDSSGILFLLQNGIHNFADQEPGYASAVTQNGSLLDATGAEFKVTVELFQKAIADKQRIMKVAGLEETFEDGDLMLVFWSRRRRELGFLNISTASHLHIERIVKSFLGSHQSDVSIDVQAVDPVPFVPDERRTNQVEAPYPGKISDLVGAIWSRSYGGSLAAESPASTSLPPEFLGEWSPGLVEMAELFESEIRTPNGTPVSFFLVGGPGSGKSTFAKDFLTSLGHIFPSTGITNLRSMDIPIGRGIVFINDASIKQYGSQDSVLNDIERASRGEMHMLVCANRGVFADELNSTSVEQNRFNYDLLLWLSQRPSKEGWNGFDILASSDYLRAARVSDPAGYVRIFVALYMDVCSLLELRPLVEVNELGWDGISSKNQKLGNVSHGQDLNYRLEAPLGQLVSRLANAIPSDVFAAEYSLDSTNPIVGNLKNLANSQHVAGLMQLLRIAEINSGTRLNYRAFWSLITRYIFGPLVDQIALVDLQKALVSLNSLSSGQDSIESFSLIVQYRSPGSLFASFEANPQDPALRLLHAVDPLLGSTPESTIAQAAKTRVKQPIEVLLDCFQSIDRDESILKIALEQGLADFVESLSQVDFAVDEMYSSLLSDGYLLEDRSSAITARYARHLSRMLATYCGFGAGAEEATIWLLLWDASPAIPSEGGILPRFNSLFKPKMIPGDGDAPSLIPLLDSKLSPLGLQSRANPRLATSLDNVHLETVKAGPDLFLVLKELGFELGRIRVDFGLLREVISSSGMTHGVTDQSSYVDPRLDRVGATKLSSSSNQRSVNFTLVLGDDLRDVFVGSSDE